MDNIVANFAAQFPFAAVVIAMLYVHYRDSKAERKYMMDIIEKQYIMLIELRGGNVSDHEETLMKRP